MSEQQTAVVTVLQRDGDSLLNFPLESDVAEQPTGERSPDPQLSEVVRPRPAVAAARAVRHYVGCLKTERVRREVWRWSGLLSMFALGVGVGSVVALRDNTGPHQKAVPGATLNTPAPEFKSEIDPARHESASVGTTGDRPVPAAGATPGVVRVAAITRPRGHRGTLVVTSQPQGARVFVNNRFAGLTPLSMRSEPAGSRAVRLSLDGYAPWSRGIRIVANQSTRVTAKLSPSE